MLGTIFWSPRSGPGPRPIPASDLRDIEQELAGPLFMGVQMGAALNDTLQSDLGWAHGDWSRSARYLNKARIVKHLVRPRRRRGTLLSGIAGRTLVTWLRSSPRYDHLLLPVLSQLADDSYTIVYGHPSVVARIPSRVPGIGWDELMTYETRAWRREYAACRPAWEQSLKVLCQRLSLPKGTRELLSLKLMVASQYVFACLEFLGRQKPLVILTEYDRNELWSCLVLAARHLGIPTVTLVHGVFERDAVGFSPVLADHIICWGEVDRRKLIAAGEPPAKLLIGGCPRLSRELSCSREQGRLKLGLHRDGPVVMYATTTADPHRQAGVELFCGAMDQLAGVAGVVRLHPVETHSVYASVSSRHPDVRFSLSSESTVDESLAAADVVVTCWSGMGSDALVKRRPLVVLNPDEVLTGPDWDLVEQAGCPHARTADELVDAVERMLYDEGLRREKARAAERYVAEFCGFFGEESARRIAEMVRQIGSRQ